MQLYSLCVYKNKTLKGECSRDVGLNSGLETSSVGLDLSQLSWYLYSDLSQSWMFKYGLALNRVCKTNVHFFFF